MKTPSEILTFVGADRARERLDVSQDRIRIAMTQEVLPSSWYAVLEDLAGRPLPRECFSFKGMTE